jgi:putative hydrolase of the HAD superfamily
MITMDVTGTIVSFRGSLEEHYLGAAKKCGIDNVDGSKISAAFGRAYKETSDRFPCFGGDEITAKQWWRECVIKSFRFAGKFHFVFSSYLLNFQLKPDRLNALIIPLMKPIK